MEMWKDPTEDGRNSLTRGMGPTTTSAPPGKGHWEDLFTDLEGWRGHTLSGSARQEEKEATALTRHMKSRSVAVMAGWGFMEWCMTRMAGSGERGVKGTPYQRVCS